MKGALLRFGRLAGWLPVAVVFSDHVGSIQSVPGSEMSPSVPSGSLAVIARNARPGSLSRGEVVSLSAPDTGARIVRRVVGLPHDRVSPSRGPPRLVTLERGFIWVEGDAEDANDRYDSTNAGPLPIALVRGRVVAVVPEGRVARRSCSRVVPPKREYH